MEDEGMLISKLKNIYIMLLSSIANENIDNVSHCLDEKLVDDFRDMISKNIKANVKQRYDMLNISNINLVKEDLEFITITAQVKYADYKVNRETGEVVVGDNQKRISKQLRIKFKKQNIEERVTYMCPNCGASLNLNAGSFCEYCGKPVNTKFSPYVLTEINQI